MTEFVKAPRFPYEAPNTAPAGFRTPAGEDYCSQCAPLSMYYFSRRLPRGWSKHPDRPRAKRVPTCTRCDKEIR